ncbi:MAG: glycerol acyltransferase [Flavobacterium sp.]|nr:MAG: glycerol acyltransferase [Flavobacterium sp.]
MDKFFYAIYSFAKRRAFTFAGIAVAVLCLLLFCASRLGFQEDITQLIPSGEKSDVTAKILGQVNFADKITIMVSGAPENADEMSAYASEFIDSIEKNCKPFIGKIQGRVDEQDIGETFNFVYQNLPLFLDQQDYEIVKRKTNPDSIAAAVEADYRSLVSPAGMVSREFILKDPLGISFMALKKLQQMSVGDDFTLHNGFVMTQEKNMLMLFITPKLPANETDRNTIFITNLDRIRDQLNKKYSGKASMEFFGATPVAVANATQIKSDVRNTSFFATISLILLLAWFYRNLLTPLLIFIPSVLGAIFALAVLYFARGTISVIALGVSSILLGETTDYSIYVLTHLRNNKNVKLLYKDISKPLLLCGATTAMTFLCLFFIKSEALKDLGLFAALNVIAASAFALMLIPLVYRNRKNREPERNALDKLASYPFDKNKILLIAVTAVLALSFFTSGNVTFNNDLSALNFVPPHLKKAEMELEKIGNGSAKSILLAAYGNGFEATADENTILASRLKSMEGEGKIVSFSSVGSLLLSKKAQREKIDRWNSFWASEKDPVKASLIKSSVDNGLTQNSFSQFYETLEKQFSPVEVANLAKVKAFYIDEFLAQKHDFTTITTIVKVPVEKRDEFVAEVSKQPGISVIDRQAANEAFLGGLKSNFGDLLDYSFIAVFIILLLAFRRIELVLVSIIPIISSWLFTTGVMGLFGLQFNIINIIVCTLVFGIGVDYSIFMTSALQKEHTYGNHELPTYRSSILLSVATTILGIGVLIFAGHPALKSIALIAIIGIGSTLLITFTLQPLAFRIIVTQRVSKGKPPYALRRTVHSTLSFIYYGLGGFLLSIVSVSLMKILPGSRAKKLRTFHFVLSKFMHSVLISYPSARRKILNEHGETFEKPAVIIANHTSFLDILAIGMLSPKIIFLVSDWVYNSPVFGKGVRLAGFYPVSSGIGNGVSHLREKVEQGFSLMVFPEGTRSEDNLIKRFHKGAFFLAEELQLDIIPVIIHGYSEVLPKGDFIINGGHTTVEILPRIAPDDDRFGSDYSARTKKLTSYFRSEYKRIRFAEEGPHYFDKMVMNSFAYKELDVVREVSNSLSATAEQYRTLSNQISEKASIFHIADDYGELDILLCLREPHRKVTTWIANELKRSVAKTNYLLRKRSISYIADVESADGNYDIILITDSSYNSLNRLSLPPTIIFVNVAVLPVPTEFVKTYDEGGIVIYKKRNI